jgi:hypothetical protein
LGQSFLSAEPGAERVLEVAGEGMPDEKTVVKFLPTCAYVFAK